MALQDEVDANRDQIAELPPALVQQFAQMAVMLPEVESDGGASIIQQILNTVDVLDLDSPWQTKDPDKLVGQLLEFTDARRAPSDYAGGLGIFLVCDATVMGSGEQVTFTTGSFAVVAQLVKAYTLDALPLRAILRQSDKPTKNGFRPHHLEIDPKQPKRK